MFERGQIWTYKTRPDEEESSVLIMRVENDEKAGSIVHVSINNVKIKKRGAADFVSTIRHIPISEEALTRSVLLMKSSDNQVPDFQANYVYWKKAFDNNEGGIWSIDLMDVVEYTERTINA